MIPFYFDDPIWILGEDTVPAGTHKLNIVGDIIHIYTIEGKLAQSAEYNKFSDITNSPQHCHRVDEINLTSVGGSASTLDIAEIEVDGLIEMHYDVVTIPTITGGTGNEPYFFTLDIHYQSTGIGTKSKDPDYYT